MTNRFPAPFVLGIVLILLAIGGCECKKCEDARTNLVGEYAFSSVEFFANGTGHCYYEHTIGIAKGGSACMITILGIDGWGTNNQLSALQAEVTTGGQYPSFSISPNQFINAGNTAGCSSWQVLQVSGSGERNANLLLLELTFTDTASNYSSGAMKYTFQAI